MEVKNYAEPWLPRLADRSVDSRALRLPFEAYYKVLLISLGASDVLAGVAIQATLADGIQAIAFGASPDHVDVIQPRGELSAVHLMLGAARGEVDNAFASRLAAWRRRNIDGTLLLAPYIVRKCAAIANLVGDLALARSYYFAADDVSSFLQTDVIPLSAEGNAGSPDMSASYYNSAWLIAVPGSSNTDAAKRYARLIAIQYQLSWGYPALVDLHRATRRFASEEHARADFASGEGEKIWSAAAGITRGVGYLKTLVTGAEELTRVVDPIRPKTWALEEGSKALADHVFPARGGVPLHHLEYHLGRPVSDQEKELARIGSLLDGVVRSCRVMDPGDESLPFVSDTRDTIVDCCTKGQYGLAFAHAKALAEETLVLSTGPVGGEWHVLRPRARGPFFRQSVVRVHQLRTQRIKGITGLTFEYREGQSYLVFMVAPDREFVMEKLKEGLFQHWAREKQRDDGEWSKIFASLLRGLRNSDATAALVEYADDSLAWVPSTRSLKLLVPPGSLNK